MTLDSPHDTPMDPTCDRNSKIEQSPLHQQTFHPMNTAISSTQEPSSEQIEETESDYRSFRRRSVQSCIEIRLPESPPSSIDGEYGQGQGVALPPSVNQNGTRVEESSRQTPKIPEVQVTSPHLQNFAEWTALRRCSSAVVPRAGLDSEISVRPPPPPPHPALPPGPGASYLPSQDVKPSFTYPPPPPPPLPPPPQLPPPPPGSFPYSTPPYRVTETRLRELMDRLQETQSQQDEHREMREEALTERRRMQNMRKDLREHRLKTRNMEAKLITELRQVCLNAKQLNFEDLFKLYEQVGDAQDILGSLEEDYEEEERHYEILEWQLGKQERDIVSDLLEDMEDIISPNPRDPLTEMPPTLRSPVPSAMRNATLELESGPSSTGDHEVRERFKDFHLDKIGSPCSTEDPEVGPKESPNEDEALRSETSETQYTDHLRKLLENNSRILQGDTLPESRRASEPAPSKGQRYLAPPVQARRPRSESDLASVQQRWSSSRAHVDQWIMESLKASKLEKAIAKAETGKEIAEAHSGTEKIDNKTWWGLFKKCWTQSTPEDSVEPSTETAEVDHRITN